jgi:hypothetical protein
MEPAVLNELRILASTRFDSHNVLTVCLAGDNQLKKKLQQDSLLPLASRMQVRLQMEHLTPAELGEFLDHTLQAAGSPHLLTRELADTSAAGCAHNVQPGASLDPESAVLWWLGGDCWGDEPSYRRLLPGAIFVAVKILIFAAVAM